MNGLEKITQRIESDAKSECDKIIAQAEADAAEIIAGYEQRARSETKRILEHANTLAVSKRKNAVNFAQLEMRMHLLSVKNELIDEAFRLAMGRLSFDEKENADLLCSIAAKAAAGEQEIILNPTVRGTLGEYITTKINALIKEMGKNAHVTLSEETRELNGLILKAGHIETNCTLDAIVASRRDDLIPPVNGCLFG